jgi:hypothetical protein
MGAIRVTAIYFCPIYSSPKSFVNEKGCVKKSSTGTLFHNPDRIAIEVASGFTVEKNPSD